MKQEDAINPSIPYSLSCIHCAKLPIFVFNEINVCLTGMALNVWYHSFALSICAKY